MKIAVLSDIHGNLDALQAVIADIESQCIDKICICGYLAMAGPEPVETIDYIHDLQGRKDITIIQGNTDEMIVRATGKPDDPFTPPNDIMAASLKFAQEVIREDQIEFLAKLPVQYEEEVGQVKILLVHGSPRQNNEDILPGQDIDKIQKMIEGTDADIIFCGHTHLPAGYQISKQTVVNDGSVGRPFTETPQACYVVLDIPDLSKKEFQVEHKFIDYDWESAARKLAGLPFYGSDKLAQMLIKATSRYPE